MMRMGRKLSVKGYIGESKLTAFTHKKWKL